MKENTPELAYLKTWMKKKYKTYSPEEILAAGGAEAFAKKTKNLYPKNPFENLSGESITDDELFAALKNLDETK